MATLTIPNTFVNATTAQAAEANANFSAIKSFIDTHMIQADGSRAMTAQLTGDGTDPTSADHLARKAYVDAQVALAVSGPAPLITVADESVDTTCFVVYVTGATGDRAPKTGSNLAFNSATGRLTATEFAGALIGNADTVTDFDGAVTDFNPSFYSATTAYTITTNDSCYVRRGNIVEVWFNITLGSNGTAVEQRMSIPTGAIHATYGASGIIRFDNPATGSANLVGHIERQTTNRVRFWMDGDTAGTYYDSGIPSGQILRGHYTYVLA